MPVERELAGGEHHHYLVPLEANQYLHVVVDQQGIDVILTLYGPDGGRLVEVDRPSGSRGPEGLSFIAETTGAFKLGVRSYEGASVRGRYGIKIDDLRDSTPRDRSRMVAERAVTEGETLRNKKTADSLRLAIERFDQALALWRDFDEPYEEAVALYAIGLCHRTLGDNQEAVASFNNALSIMRRIDSLYGQAVSQTGLAWALLYLGENERALSNFSDALQLREKLQDLPGKGLTLYGIGWAQAMLGRDEEALDSFFRSLEFRRAAKDRRGEALTLAGIGKIQNRLGKRSEGLDNLNRSLTLLREMGDAYGEADVLSEMGWTYSALKQYDLAIEYLQKALPMRQSAGDRIGEATTRYGIARTERLRGNPLEAVDHIESAIKIIESLRQEGLNQQLRLSYFASVQDYYEFYIDLLMRMDRLHPSQGYSAAALQVNERARARNMLDVLTEARADIRQGVDPLLLERERSLQQQLSSAADRRSQLISRRHTEIEAATVEKEIGRLTLALHETQAQIRQSSQRYASLVQPRPLTLTRIQKEVLDDETLLLEYAIGEERSYLWAVTRTSIDSHPLPGRAEVETAARRAYELLTARNQRVSDETPEQRRLRIAQADAAYVEAASRLSRMLLGPAVRLLGGRRLAIVTQGALEYVPFGALPSPGSEMKPGEKLRPLIVDHEIVRLPSASTLALLRSYLDGRTPAPRRMAVIADPVFSRADKRVRGDSAAGGDRARKASVGTSRRGISKPRSYDHFPRLSGTRWEAESIAALAPPGEALLALDFAASRALATSPELGQYRILHFATHAVIDTRHPELSGIALSQTDERGNPQDGFLYMHDISGLRLGADLVVLSACRTGLGKDVRGEGLLGLTRGFMYAGAPRVVVSLWDLDDRATAGLMVKFYKRMVGDERMRPAAALRAAQVEMWEEGRWPSPYYWAGFVLQGEWR